MSALRGSAHLKFEIIVPITTTLSRRNALDIIEEEIKGRARALILEKIPEAQVIEVKTGHIYFHGDGHDEQT